MDKTKFGITVGALSAVGYLCGYLSMTAMIIFFVFTLAFSAERVVKVNALQSLCLSFFFLIIKIIMGWIGDLYGDLVGLIYKISDKVGSIMAGGSTGISIVSEFVSFAETVIFVILIFMAFSGKIVKIPVIAKIAEKHIPEEE